MSINKIKKTREFSKIYNNSKKIYTKYTIIFVNKNNTNKKFGFVASKKTGNAVNRNRIKRLFREVIKNNQDKFKEKKDYIIVGKAILKENIANLCYKDIEKDILKGLKNKIITEE